jgi:hypothetical protein
MVTAAFLILMLAGLTLGFLDEGLAERTAVNHHETSLLALEHAETGLVLAEMELAGGLDRGTDGLGNVSGEHLGGSYQVTAQSDGTTAAGDELWILRSLGEHGLSRRRLEGVISVSKGGPWQHAIYARQNLTIDSSVQTDAFDSRKGTWASQAVNKDALGWYAQPTGHIGSDMSITIRSSVIVRGDAKAGPGYTTTLVGSSCKVYGNKTPKTSPLNLPDPALADFTSAFTTNNNGSLKSGADISWNKTTMNLTVNGSAKLTLAAGTYAFRDLILDGSAQLLVAGPCKIYVTGRLWINSSVLCNAGGKAINLQFFAHPYALPTGTLANTTATVEIDSSMKGAFAVYAPGRNVNVNSSIELEGAIVGKTVVLDSSAKIHYDRALAEVRWSGSGAASKRIYWRETTTPPR